MHTMTATIGRLRALLLDEGWSEDHRADALRTLAEIEAAWDALLAPSDVEKDVERIAREIVAPHLQPLWDDYEYKHWARDAVRPLVAARARLAREVEAAHRSEAACVREALEQVGALKAERDAARAEIARLTAELEGAHEALDSVVTRRDTVDGPLLSLTMRAATVARIAEEAYQQIGSAQSEIRRLRTAGPGEAWERLVTVARLACDDPVNRAMGDVRAALAAVEPRVDVKAREIAASLATHAEILGGDSRTVVATHEVRLDGETAIVAEQWTDGAEVVKRYEVRMRFAEFVHLALNTTPEERREVDARGDWRGVEPRADAVAADPSAPVDRCDCKTGGVSGEEATSTGTCAACRASDDYFKRAAYGALDGSDVDDMRAAAAPCEPTVDVTAITHDFRPGAQDGMPRLADVEAREIAAPPVHPDLARRLAGSVAARPVAPAMTAELAREDLAQKIRDLSDERKAELAPVFEEALAMRPPPRALTEAEARQWAEMHAEQVAETCNDFDAEHDALTKMLLASNRGDVPPEVRPTVPGCDGGHPGCGVCDALDETAGVEEVDPSAAKIAAVPSPACNVDHTTDERPRVLGGECADCLHRPPLHEPTCTKARCSHVVEICEGCDDPVSECVCDEGRRARASEARTWTEEQIRTAWYRAQETGRPEHERPREPDDLANGWEHLRAALHGEAV